MEEALADMRETMQVMMKKQMQVMHEQMQVMMKKQMQVMNELGSQYTSKKASRDSLDKIGSKPPIYPTEDSK